ncbi:MAG: MFS transporter [Deltaproteobacteria bacterium]|nr:MFS transporter [Deltaproteobacteria bacterium]
MSAPARLMLMYAGIFLGVGIMMSFLPLHLRTLGFSATAMGAVFALRPAVQVVTPTLWGMWADHRGDARFPLRLATVGSLLAFVPLLFSRDAAVVSALLLLQTAFGAGLVPLTDGMTLATLHKNPGGFGRVRVAGTVSFGVGVLGFSVLLGPTGGSMEQAGEWSVPAILAAMAACVATSLLLPEVPPQPRERGAKVTALIRPLWLFLLVNALHWAAHATYTVFFGVHVADLGLGPHVVSVSLVAAVGVETVVLFAAPRLMQRFSTRVLLVAAILVAILRWWVSSWATAAWLIVGAQALHGVSFGLAYVLGVTWVRARVPDEARSTGQGLFTAVVFGGGGTLGTALAGVAYDAGRGAAAFNLAVVLELAALALFAAGEWRAHRAR